MSFSEEMQEKTNESYEYGILKEKNFYLEPHFLIGKDKNALALLQSAKTDIERGLAYGFPKEAV